MWRLQILANSTKGGLNLPFWAVVQQNVDKGAHRDSDMDEFLQLSA